MDSRKMSLTEGKISPTLIRFALPFLMASLLQALYGAVDLFVVGRYDSSAAVSAVAIGSQLMHTITGIVLGISMGGTVLIGRCIGEKDEEGVARAVGSMTTLFALVAAVLTPVMLFCNDFAARILQTPEEAMADAKTYLFICACGIPFIVGYNAVSGIFRGIGDSKTPMFFIAVACGINIACDFLLVGYFRMGAAGAALATVFAQGSSLVFSLLYIAKKGFAFEIRRKHFRLYKKSVGYILKVGSPLALQDALVNGSFLIITAVVNTMGLVASAAVGVVEKLIGFVMLPPSAFSSAVATMTAQNIGANKPKRALRALQLGIGFSLFFGICVFVYAQFLPETLTSLFSTDKDVIQAAGQYLKAFSIDCMLVSFVFNMNAFFSGCGKSVVSFIHSMIATFGVRIPMTYFISRIPGITLYPMGLAAPAASLISIIICGMYFVFLAKRESKNSA